MSKRAKKVVEWCSRCSRELKHGDVYTCLPCSIGVKEYLLSHGQWREQAVGRIGDRLDENLLQTIAREFEEESKQLKERYEND